MLKEEIIDEHERDTIKIFIKREEKFTGILMGRRVPVKSGQQLLKVHHPFR